MDENTFGEVWLLSPNYVASFRPAVGEEVPAEKIARWQVLRLEFGKEPGQGPQSPDAVETGR